MLVTFIGVSAAALTSLSYIPQVRKVLAGQPTDDLSLHTLIALTAGLVLWIVYGYLTAEIILLAANSVGTVLTGIVLFRKILDARRLKHARSFSPVGQIRPRP